MRALRKLILLAVLSPGLSHAQPYSIDWHKFSGGGGSSASTNGSNVYSLSGAIGQPDASGAMTGGSFSLTGGFLAIYAVPTPGAPLLSILATNGMIMVSWPSPSPGFTLQVNADLSTANWVIPPQTVQSNGTTRFILINPPIGSRFFRLAQP